LDQPPVGPAPGSRGGGYGRLDAATGANIAANHVPAPAAAAAAANDPNASFLDQSSHPVVLVFHLLFKSVSLAFYILANWFTDDFVFIFVVQVLLHSFDFWTVKNISGRMLVGLRWWNEERPDGTSVWVYESRDPSRPVNAFDARVFWTTLYAFPAAWLILALLAFIRMHLEWMLIPVFALALATANLIGYGNCEKDARQKYGRLADAMGAGGGMSGWLLKGVVDRGVKSIFGNGGTATDAAAAARV